MRPPGPKTTIMQEHALLTEQEIAQFIRSHGLPPAFRGLISDHYLPLVAWLMSYRTTPATTLLGISGAQGTGKSTLADFLKFALESRYEWRVAVLSIDDFYLTRAERRALADNIHPLFATRGVPGTHDVAMLSLYLEKLRDLKRGEQIALPRFAKASDDRAAASSWPSVSGPVDLVILEGWCVGSVAEDDADLATSANELERDRDPTGRWRGYVNDRLKSDYAELFATIDALVFLQAPGFDAACRWRLEQEQKLAESASANMPGLMNERELAEFMQFYERITRNNFAVLPGVADVVLELDEDHNCIACRYA